MQAMTTEEKRGRHQGVRLAYLRFRISATVTPWIISSAAGNSCGYFGIFSAQEGLTAVGHVSLERAFIVDERRDDVTIARSHLMFEHDHVTVHDVLSDH